MNFSYNYSQHSHKNRSVYLSILTDAVFGGLGLVPLILEPRHHKNNPDGECLDVEQAKSLLKSHKKRSRTPTSKKYTW